MPIHQARVEPRSAGAPGGTLIAMPFAAFLALQFRHRFTELLTCAPRAGRTTWAAGGDVELRWYWQEVAPGVLVIDQPYRIATNVHVRAAPLGYSAALMSAVYLLKWQPVVQSAAKRLISRNIHTDKPPLSGREVEVLRWAKAGKTAWETGQILGVGEPTVKKLLRAAYGKLEAAGKASAILAADQLGLI